MPPGPAGLPSASSEGTVLHRPQRSRPSHRALRREYRALANTPGGRRQTVCVRISLSPRLAFRLQLPESRRSTRSSQAHSPLSAPFSNRAWHRRPSVNRRTQLPSRSPATKRPSSTVPSADRKTQRPSGAQLPSALRTYGPSPTLPSAYRTTQLPSRSPAAYRPVDSPPSRVPTTQLPSRSPATYGPSATAPSAYRTTQWPSRSPATYGPSATAPSASDGPSGHLPCRQRTGPPPRSCSRIARPNGQSACHRGGDLVMNSPRRHEPTSTCLNPPRSHPCIVPSRSRSRRPENWGSTRSIAAGWPAPSSTACLRTSRHTCPQLLDLVPSPEFRHGPGHGRCQGSHPYPAAGTPNSLPRPLGLPGPREALPVHSPVTSSRTGAGHRGKR